MFNEYLTYMLSFYHYSKLSPTKKIDYLNKRGHYLCNRTFLKYQIKLYYVDDFYAEIWIDPNNKVFNIFPFTTTRCLKPYLDLIDISDVSLI